MKKQLIIALAALLLLAAGCGKNAPDPNAPRSPGSGSSNSGGNNNSGGSNNSGGGNNQSGGSNNSGGGNNQSGGSGAPVQPTGPVKLGPLKAGEAGKLGDLELTVKSVEVITTAAGLPPGYVFVLLNLRFTNTGPDYPINFTNHLRFMTPEGKKINTSAQATGQRSPRLGGTVTKAEAVEGYLGYLTKNVPGTFQFIFGIDESEATWEFTVQ